MHEQECIKSGNAFEDYIARVLQVFHHDYINPTPTGSLGDFGSDGVADQGRSQYAIYGQRPGRLAEKELADKITSDFNRAFDKWPNFEVWRFVTNAPVGPLATQSLIKLQQTYVGPDPRKIDIGLVNPDKFWHDFVGKLAGNLLEDLFPGAPGNEDVQLADLLPLLQALDGGGSSSDDFASIQPVSPSKMDYNQLNEGSRYELNTGRIMAPRINSWYELSSNAELYDKHANRFQQLYLNYRSVTTNPNEIFERLYVAIAGRNFRMDSKRANAAYCVVSYFFDACHIFEDPKQHSAVN